jgi:hypothetical protein
MSDESRLKQLAEYRRISDPAGYVAALHEICHALVFIAHGFYVADVSIQGGGGVTRHERYRPPVEKFDGFLSALVAGGVGECRYLNRPFHEWCRLPGIASDLARVKRYCGDFPPACESFQNALADADRCLGERWPHVLTLADVLLEKRQLTLTEIGEHLGND